MAILITFALGTLGALALTFVRPTVRCRRQNRWLVRPRVEAVGPTAALNGVSRVLETAGAELWRSGFEPFVTARIYFGISAGVSVWRWQAVWVRNDTHDSAIATWQQMSSSRWGAWTPDIDLYFVRSLEPSGRRMSQIHLADRSAGGTMEWTTDPADIGAAYERFAVLPQAAPTRARRYADGHAYVSAIEANVEQSMAAWMAGQARPDPTGEWYLYGWRAAFTAVLRQWWGTANRQDAARGFEVIPVASAAG